MFAALILLVIGFVAGFWVGTGSAPTLAEFGLEGVPGGEQFESVTERVFPPRNP